TSLRTGLEAVAFSDHCCAHRSHRRVEGTPRRTFPRNHGEAVVAARSSAHSAPRGDLPRNNPAALSCNRCTTSAHTERQNNFARRNYLSLFTCYLQPHAKSRARRTRISFRTLP